MKIGIQELLVVFIVALIFVGPDKLPYYAKKLGQAFGQFRKYTEEATKDIRESVVEPLNEAQRPLREAMEPVTELGKDINNNINDIKKSFSDIGKPVKEKSGKPDAASSDQESVTEQATASAQEQDAGSSEPEPVQEQEARTDAAPEIQTAEATDSTEQVPAAEQAV